MRVTPYLYNNINLQIQNRQSFAKSDGFNSCTPGFTGSKISAASEKGFNKFEYMLRVVANKFRDLFESKQVKAITKNIAEVKPESSGKYLELLDEISRYYSSNKKIRVNIEDNILEEIASSGKPTIFIMNHSNQFEDPSMLAVLNHLLSDAYMRVGQKDKFPIPKIILNQDILTTMNPTKRKAFEAFGAVGIDASIIGADKQTNARAFFPVIKDFVRGKCNIFIFPEGRMATRTYLDLDQRFQPGVAEIINKILGINKEIQIVPVGFSYGKGGVKNMTSMHIGEPVIFKRNGKHTTTTTGSIMKSEFAFDGFKSFFEKHKNETDIVITENGVPVEPKDTVRFIRRLLSENLNICAKEADKKLTLPPDREVLLV